MCFNINKFNEKRLSFQLTLLGFLIICIGAVTGATILIAYQYWEAQKTLNKRVEIILSSSEIPLSAALYNLDRSTLDDLIQGIGSHPEVTKAEIIEKNGLFEATYRIEEHEFGVLGKIINEISSSQLIFRKMIREPIQNGAEIGELIVTINPAFILIPAFKQGGNFIVIFFLIDILLIMTYGYITQRKVTQPLSEISLLISKLNPAAPMKHDLLAEDKFKSVEFRMLLRSTNKFLTELNKHLQEKSRYEESIIKAENETNQSQIKLIDAIESINDGFILRDKDQKVILCNSRYFSFYPSAASVFSLGVDYEVLLRKIAESDIVPDEPINEWIRNRNPAVLTRNVVYHEILNTEQQIKITEMSTSSGGIVGIHSDITELKIAEDELRYRADYDLLTGMLNRNRLVHHMDDVITRCKRDQTRAGILFIDLDRFKNVNDTLGHSFGDELLKQAADRIRKVIRNSDFCARLGGDEFAVLLPDVKDDYGCTVVSQKIIRSLSSTFKIQSNEILLSASIGISIYPDDAYSSSTLLQHADMAMYRAKQKSRGIFKFYNEEMSNHAEKIVQLEKELAHALTNEEFYLNFQPIIALPESGELHPALPPVGVEVLIRWNHPHRGFVPPDEFIGVTEETGQIAAIGEWVLRKACQQAIKWIHDYPCYLDVNVSYRQFQKGFDCSMVKRILDETGFPAHHLSLEITESLLIDDDEHMLSVLTAFKKMGVSIVIDDFGTGYSSLNYLKKYPLDVLKIDKSFICDLEKNGANKQLVATILAMAKGMNLKVVAEGVETSGQAAILRELQCDYAQGYYFSRPLLEEDMIAYFRKSAD